MATRKTVKKKDDLANHRVVSRKAWTAARRAFLAKEKRFTRSRDALARARRALPWEKVEKSYVFDGPNGRESLEQLFAGKSQLVVYHFMYPPDWEEGCRSCSFWADSFNPLGVHLKHRDTTLVAISRAPYAKIEAFKRRMGWTFKWLSSSGTDFNYDFQASFKPEDFERKVYNFGTLAPGMSDREGLSVFYRDPSGAIYRTYATFARGIEPINTVYDFLDMVPRGRYENPENVHDWVRHHDRYPD